MDPPRAHSLSQLQRLYRAVATNKPIQELPLTFSIVIFGNKVASTLFEKVAVRTVVLKVAASGPAVKVTAATLGRNDVRSSMIVSGWSGHVTTTLLHNMYDTVCLTSRTADVFEAIFVVEVPEAQSYFHQEKQ